MLIVMEVGTFLDDTPHARNLSSSLRSPNVTCTSVQSYLVKPNPDALAYPVDLLMSTFHNVVIVIKFIFWRQFWYYQSYHLSKFICYYGAEEEVRKSDIVNVNVDQGIRLHFRRT